MIELRCGDGRALVSTLGGELAAWRAVGRELIWTPDARFWDRSAPLLFPAVGWRRNGKIRVDGQDYPLGVHGFAASQLFEVVEQSEAALRLRLQDNEQTRAQYPFAFEFDVTYALRNSTLEIALEICNRGGGHMPYACGLHPGFRWPFALGAREDYRLEFERDEAPFVPEIAPGGLFSARQRAIALQGRSMALNDDVFAREALCFLNARSRAISFCAPDGARIVMTTEGFPHLAIWSRYGAPFLCLEAWTGHGDREGFEGDIFAIPSMIVLQPGERRGHSATFAIHGP